MALVHIVKNTPLKKDLLHSFGLSSLLRTSGWHLDPLTKGRKRDQGHGVVIHDQEEDCQQAMTPRSGSKQPLLSVAAVSCKS